MAAEIAFWTKEIMGLTSALRNASETVETLRFKRKLKGDELNPVAKNLNVMSKKIDNVKNIGSLLGYYMEYSKCAHDIRTISDKIGELVINLNEKSPESEWKSIRIMFETVKEAHEEFKNIKTGGGRWLDEKDRGRILTRLEDVTVKYTTAKGYLDEKRSGDLEGSITKLKDEAMSLEKLFNGSINDMLKGLISI